MPYLNMDDKYPQHPKIDALSDAAFRLHTAALCHCAEHLTDGFVDQQRVPRLVPRFRRSAVEELIGARLWMPVKGGYEIHDYLQWNKPRSWWVAKRERDAKRKAEWREKHADE